MMKDEERKSLISKAMRFGKKAERAAPDQVDALGNRIPPPSEKKRKDLKALTQWVEPEVIAQIKLIAAEQRKQQKEIVNEALNMVFARYRKGEIA